MLWEDMCFRPPFWLKPFLKGLSGTARISSSVESACFSSAFEPGSEAILKSFFRKRFLPARTEKGFSQSSNAAKLHHGPNSFEFMTFWLKPFCKCQLP